MLEEKERHKEIWIHLPEEALNKMSILMKRVAMLHECAEANGGNFPPQRAVHPDHPERKRSNCTDKLSRAYVNNKHTCI